MTWTESWKEIFDEGGTRVGHGIIFCVQPEKCAQNRNLKTVSDS